MRLTAFCGVVKMKTLSAVLKWHQWGNVPEKAQRPQNVCKALKTERRFLRILIKCDSDAKEALLLCNQALLTM